MRGKDAAAFAGGGSHDEGVCRSVGGFESQVVMAVPAAARQPEAQRIALGGVPLQGEPVSGARIEHAGNALM